MPDVTTENSEIDKNSFIEFCSITALALRSLDNFCTRFIVLLSATGIRKIWSLFFSENFFINST